MIYKRTWLFPCLQPNKTFRVLLISRINPNATNHLECKNFLLGQMARFRGETAPLRAIMAYQGG